jgi:SOS response regulatory protein OraA/RecX
MDADPVTKLMQKAGALLARRSYSRGELRARLARHGEAQQIESVLDRLEQLNLLNDAEYAYNSAVRWMRQEGWGPVKVRSLLLRRQVSSLIAEAAIDRVRLEIGETGALESYLDRRGRTRPLPGDRRGIHKLIMILQRRGFSSETISEVLRHRIPAAAWNNFETGE